MRRIAVVKPDHVGDLVLAAPAIAWLVAQSRSVMLFVQEENLPLARYLFPEVPATPLQLPHLVKGSNGEPSGLTERLSVLHGYDVVVFLRTDHVLNRERIRHLVGPSIFADSSDQQHETTNHRFGIRVYFGDYDSCTVWPSASVTFPTEPRVIGLCLGSGFPSNKWSVIRWVELGRRLLTKGVALRLIGGTQERTELEIVANAIGLDADHIIIGSRELEPFLHRVRETDVVIASDGGSGHLCSLVVPILTIAASVPFRRFAPFGLATRVVSLDLRCSPCLNTHERYINGCFSHECSYGITTEDVLEALSAPPQSPGTVLAIGTQAKLFYSPSHA